MSDRESARLRGLVAVCQTEQPGKGLVTWESFRRDGNWTEQWHRNRNGLEWKAVRRYDAEGRVREEERSAPEAQIFTYTYSPTGRLACIDVRSPGGPPRLHESYVYNDDHTSVVTLYIDPPLREMKNVAVSADQMLHMSIDAVRIITMRDSEGKPVEKVLYDIDNRTIRRVLFRHDGAGRLLEEGEAEGGGSVSADMRKSYRYDAEGRCIEDESHWGAFGGQRKTMSYNKQGDLWEERIAPFPGEVSLHGSAPWLTHYDYEYDAQDNWTSRNEQVHKLDGEPIRTEVTKRGLIYWDSSQALA